MIRAAKLIADYGLLTKLPKLNRDVGNIMHLQSRHWLDHDFVSGISILELIGI
jgi:hypothetical protein